MVNPEFLWHPDQINAFQAEVDNKFEWLPPHIGNIVLARLNVALPDIQVKKIKPKNFAGQLVFDIADEAADLAEQCVYPFLRRTEDYGSKINAHVSYRSKISKETINKAGQFVDVVDGSSYLVFPLIAGYWVPERVVRNLTAHPGTGKVSPLSHYFKMALIACRSEKDYVRTASLARKLTGANQKLSPHPEWLK